MSLDEALEILRRHCTDNTTSDALDIVIQFINEAEEHA